MTSIPPFLTPLIDPIAEYDHAVGQSIVGGYVYRGRALGATYRGRYFFADFSQGRVSSIALTVDAATGNASASGLIEHTNELGGLCLAISAHSVSMPMATLYVVSTRRASC